MWPAKDKGAINTRASARLLYGIWAESNIDGMNMYASCAIISHQDFDNEAIFST